MPVCRYEKLVQCPYEKSHLVTPDKLITHLTKCRKQHLKKYPTPTIVVCPYKSTHHVPEAEFENHVENCDAKDLAVHMLLERSTPAIKPTASIASALNGARNDEVVTDDEDWETQQIRAPYDPAARIMDKEVLRKPVGLTKAERKEFCVNERARRRFLAERREAKQSLDNDNNAKDFASNTVIRRQSTSLKSLYNNAVQTSDSDGRLEDFGTLRRPKLVAAPSRPIFFPTLPQNDEMLEPLQQPRLRRPNTIMTPTRNLKENAANLNEKNEDIGNEDHYDKYVAEKIQQLKI